MHFYWLCGPRSGSWGLALSHPLPARQRPPTRSPMVSSLPGAGKSTVDPHDVLGVRHDADESQVRKAYKRLALKLHPDVNQDELAEAKFRTLREAYELLLGKGDPDRAHNAPFGGNWEFHDWYWTFSMRQRQRRQSSSAPGHSSAAAQQHRPKVNSQLSNLKSRARRRQAAGDAAGDPFARDGRARRPSRDPSPAVEAPTLASHPRATSPPPRPSQRQQSGYPSRGKKQSAQRHGQRRAASSVHHHPAHHFDPLNLFSSGQPEACPAFSTFSPLSGTLEGELHHFQQVRTRSRSVSKGHSTAPLHSQAPTSQSPLDVGFWGSIAQHFSSPRSGFLEETMNRHNVCMQNATQHVVEMVAGVGSHMHAGLSQHFTGTSSLHGQAGDIAGHSGSAGQDPPFSVHASTTFRTADRAQSAPPRMHADVAASSKASQRVADAAMPEPGGGAADQEWADSGDVEQSTDECNEASYSQPRFVATEERRSAVRSQLAGLRRKARLHAQ